jgi:hypothetical protein
MIFLKYILESYYKSDANISCWCRHNLCKDTAETYHKPLQFDGNNLCSWLLIYSFFYLCYFHISCCFSPLSGFFSFFLYKRWYRCHTSLSSFSSDTGDLERKEDISHDEFSLNYDGKKPVRHTFVLHSMFFLSDFYSFLIISKLFKTFYHISKLH